MSIYNIDHSLTVRVQGGNEVLEGGSTEHNVSLSGPVPASTTVDVTGWEGTDVTVDNAALIFTTSNWSEPQTVTITADEDDDASNDRLSLKYQSRIGAQEYGNITLSMTVRDDEELAVAIGGVPAKINSTTALSVRFTFSEAVTGFETGDVNISGGTRGAFAGSGTTYTLAVTPTSGSNVTVEVAANSATLGGGNTGPSSAVSAMATWDAAAPTVSINDVPAKINSKTPFTAEFEFSEAVTGFVIGDVTVTGGTRGAFAGSGTTYTLAVTPTGGADVVVTVAADAATDGLNTGPASEVSATATWDAAAPTVSINDVPAK
ncbi:MAG: Ig-like domain-containing protein, partial [Bacteroidota bacterium]|nr:Ig-like domain-containing protein [Bacteroidota bacterium]